MNKCIRSSHGHLMGLGEQVSPLLVAGKPGSEPESFNASLTSGSMVSGMFGVAFTISGLAIGRKARRLRREQVFPTSEALFLSNACSFSPVFLVVDTTVGHENRITCLTGGGASRFDPTLGDVPFRKPLRCLTPATISRTVGFTPVGTRTLQQMRASQTAHRAGPPGTMTM